VYEDEIGLTLLKNTTELVANMSSQAEGIAPDLSQRKGAVDTFHFFGGFRLTMQEVDFKIQLFQLPAEVRYVPFHTSNDSLVLVGDEYIH
jgi:hypothetical protein